MDVCWSSHTLFHTMPQHKVAGGFNVVHTGFAHVTGMCDHVYIVDLLCGSGVVFQAKVVR
jgi:hypothetical protein